jgi:hypothetical protein
MKGFIAALLVSISGTSTCQPLKSFPLKRLYDCEIECNEQKQVNETTIDIIKHFFILAILFGGHLLNKHVTFHSMLLSTSLFTSGIIADGLTP